MTDRKPKPGRAKALNDDGEVLETRGKPTARDAHGNKQPGYGGHGEPDPEQQPLPLGK